MFTSGTTGAPKGAMLKHSAVVRGYNDWADIIGLQARDRYLIVNPFFIPLDSMQASSPV
ncbi:MAG: hypothetical protein CM15mP49_00260 [Actinomycetota bacterium]|nr:MAG: hypothetical protein CM15mP49_00260 [Actinomycetota bacterium]